MKKKTYFFDNVTLVFDFGVGELIADFIQLTSSVFNKIWLRHCRGWCPVKEKVGLLVWEIVSFED